MQEWNKNAMSFNSKETTYYFQNDPEVIQSWESAKAQANPDYLFDLTYKGVVVPIFNDDYGQQWYCIIDGQEYGFGAFNSHIREDLKYLINSFITEKNIREHNIVM